MEDFFEQLAKPLSENSSAFLDGFFVMAGVFLGWFLNLLTTEYQNKSRLIFTIEGTPDYELTDPELRTKTSPSELSVRITNMGSTAYFLENFSIVRKGHWLVDCYGVCEDHKPIMPNESVLYTLMQQDADTLERNFSKYYKKPVKAYLTFVHAMQHLPILGNRIAYPEFAQGKCRVIAYSIDGKSTCSHIDLVLLCLRHSIRRDVVVDVVTK